MFVDGYDFTAYKEAGFIRFDEQDKDVAKGVSLSAPELDGFGEWWKYLSNASKLSPIPKGKGFEFPEGVLRLGGTFVLNGDEIVYQWSDRLPGDHPEINDVLSIAKEAAANKKESSFSIDGMLKNIFS